MNLRKGPKNSYLHSLLYIILLILIALAFSSTCEITLLVNKLSWVKFEKNWQFCNKQGTTASLFFDALCSEHNVGIVSQICEL